MSDNHTYQWLATGDDYYSAVLAAIASARESIRLETYIFSAGKPGDDVLAALVAAARKGIKTRVLVDAFGSYELPADYWKGFIAAGGELRLFNPLSLNKP